MLPSCHLVSRLLAIYVLLSMLLRLLCGPQSFVCVELSETWMSNLSPSLGFDTHHRKSRQEIPCIGWIIGTRLATNSVHV